ncbi:MAG: DUF342 domain-containing protein [Lachnospiraceae bacterium]|nr:DUF342 domain-containing protein [Lachnospiraceae bacterium]
MEEISRNAPQVRIGMNDMEAFLYLPVPENEDYTVGELESALRDKGVVHGVKSERLEQMVRERSYRREVLVAEGVAAKEGKDGYYDYHFNRNLDGKPTVRPDGSVDYWSINRVEIVKEGQVIAEYHPAIMGENGITVKGKPIMAKRARELPPLKGKGFTRSEDNRVYTSDFDGKIEMKNDRITVSKVYEISGNADLSVGNIDFNGDVLVHGNVCAGVQIKAAGTITVDGIVETADLWAGKDIILRGGMMGGSKSTVFTKGNITAKFFEYTIVEAWGEIQAQVFMNCDVTCKKRIILNGKEAGIIGGKVHAIQGIEVGDLGNDVEIRTEVRVGNDVEVLRRIKALQKEVTDMSQMLERVEKGLKELERLAEAQALEKNDPRKMQLLRVKIRDSATLGGKQAELGQLEQQLEDAKYASIRALRSVYPGVMVIIDEARLFIRTPESHVEYRKEKGEVVSLYTF